VDVWGDLPAEEDEPGADQQDELDGRDPRRDERGGAPGADELGGGEGMLHGGRLFRPVPAASFL